MRTLVLLLRWPALALLTASAGWVIYRLLTPRSAAALGWPDAACLCCLCAVLVMAHCRSLPCQNVLFAGAVLAALAAAAELAAGWFDFSLLSPGPTAAPKLFGVLAWPIPLLWLSGILLARGIARVLLQGAVGSRNYGLLVFGGTIFLFLVFQIGLHAFAAAKTGSGSANLASAVESFRMLAGGALAFLILLAITPLLLEKKPVKSPVSRVPVFAWTVVNVIFLAAALVDRAWLHFVVIALTLAVVNLAAWQTRQPGRTAPP